MLDLVLHTTSASSNLSTCTSCNCETRDMLTLQTQVSHFHPLLLQVFMCSWCSSRCTSTPPPLTIVVLVSMKNVFHLRIVLRNPCSNSAVTTEPWVHHLHPKSSILFLHWPWFNIYHFIHAALELCCQEIFFQKQDAYQFLLRPTADFYRNIRKTMLLTKYLVSASGESFRYSSIFSNLPPSWWREKEIFWILWNWRLICGISMLLYSRGIKEFTCKLTLDPNLLSIFTTAII